MFYMLLLLAYVGHLEVEFWHLDGRQVSRSGQSLMTSISGPESQIDLKIGGTHDHKPIHQI